MSEEETNTDTIKTHLLSENVAVEEPRLNPSAPLDEELSIEPNPQNHIFQTSQQPSVILNHSLPVYPKMAVEQGPPTIFGRVPERNVTFCIDTSGSMFQCLDVVKDHLMETLFALASQENQPMFNLIEFNSQVTKWADKLVKCTPETVAVAGKWVRDLQAKTGTNTQDALLAALSDPSCQAIYLVTDGLPDQYPEEVLDNVVGVCGNRRIHCIYITGETADEAATEFLEDLAVETYGSFHIVTLTTHGCVERVTPIYRSDHTHEKIVHTVNNTLRPNIKTCSVSTTLQIDPDEVLGLTPSVRSMLYQPSPLVLPSPLVGYGPTRYYYPYYWSRYRPAKAWLKAQDKLFDPLLGLSPAAGSVLVGKKVIARRIEDGFFYKATVQSQCLGEKFLVAFGPCKHGKYRQTEYQDTYVFDIVDYPDALRHTIITGDRVLAPWEPEGERFAPGIVIDGHEKRHAEGPDDRSLTVSFSNGRTEKIPQETAVWLPPSVYERLSLELQMPKEARQSLLSYADNYPMDNLPGYPSTGPIADPPDYPVVDPFVVEPNSLLWDPYLYRYPPYLPAYYGYPPFVVSRRQKSDRTIDNTKAADDGTTIIPGTNMTKKELDDRVMSQLMEHRLTMAVDEISKSDSKGSVTTKEANSKILDKRNNLEENHLKKSVHFRDGYTEEINVGDGPTYFDDSAFDEYGNPKGRADHGVNTDSSLLFYRSQGLRGRPKWNYWRNDPSPNVSDVGISAADNRRARSPGPFRETALQAPLEARDQREPPYNVEWQNSAFQFVDTFAKHDHSYSVEECLSGPKPPPKREGYQQNRNYVVTSRAIAAMTPEEREEAGRANRRRRVLKREADWHLRVADEDHVKALMQDNHRERIISQMERDRQRQIKEQTDIEKVREAKKKISSELKARIEKNQKEEVDKETQRLLALQRRRERRDKIQTQRDKEIEVTMQRREQIKKQNTEARLKAWTTQLDEQDSKAAASDKQHRDAKLRRLKQFQEIEKVGQQKKDLRLAVKEQHQALYRSQIFA